MSRIVVGTGEGDLPDEVEAGDDLFRTPSNLTTSIVKPTIGEISEGADGLTRVDIEIPNPSASRRPGDQSVQAQNLVVVSTIYHKVVVRETENSAWKEGRGSDLGNNYKTLEGAYSFRNEDDDADCKEKDIQFQVGRTMAAILIDLSNRREVKAKNDNKSLTKEQLLAIISFARKSGGVAHKKNEEEHVALFRKSLEEDFKELVNCGISQDLATNFSFWYQRECQSCGIYSREPNSSFGHGLTFLPQEALKRVEEINVGKDGNFPYKLKEDSKKLVSRKKEEVKEIIEAKVGNFSVSDLSTTL